MDFQGPSPKLWTARRAQLAAVVIVLAAGGITAAAWSGEGPATWLAGALVLVALAGLAALILWRRVQAWGYAERDEDLIVRRGVLVRRLTVVPYGRMQFIEVTAGPVDRVFGLATVQLHTAAAASDARIPGLDAAEAARLRDRLAALGEARAAGL